MSAEYIEAVAELAETAGEAVMAVYRRDFAVEEKADETPVTAADLAAHRVIAEGLDGLTPKLPLLSEESAPPAYAERRQWRRYWLVDPLDGTKEFVKRNGEFTVNIALIEDHRPVLGVVHVPVTGVSYVGCLETGAERRSEGVATAIEVSGSIADPVRVVGSRTHRGPLLDDWLEALGPHTLVSMGSSLKFCVVAEGGADVYPRLGPTSEWDTAAAQAVVEAAGGQVLTWDGAPLAYNAKEALLNPHFLVCAREPERWLAVGRNSAARMGG